MRTVNWIKQLRPLYHSEKRVKLGNTIYKMNCGSSGISDSDINTKEHDKHNESKTMKDVTSTAKESNVMWNIIDSLLKQQFSNIGHYAVLILNRPILIPEQFMCNLWNGASFRTTADGGTDRWYNFVSNMKEKSKLNHIHPNLVTGDFDSVCPETLQNCKEHGVNIVETPSQDHTDFNKALDQTINHFNDRIDCIITIVENSGRLDHLMSNFNVLYTEMAAVTPVFLLCSDSISWLLRPGCHQVCIPQELVQIQAPCGLIPLGNPCIVTTTGLKWNLNNTKMEFGGIVSSSNTYDSDCQGVVTIQTDSALLFTVNLCFNEQ